MTKRATVTDVLVLLAFVSLAGPVQGQTGVTNGDFSSALEPAWTVVEPNNVEWVLYDPAQPDDGFVLFTEPGDPSEGTAPVLDGQLPVAAIWQNFDIQADPSLFSFRFYFSHGTTSTPPTSDDPISPTVRPPDSFSV